VVHNIDYFLEDDYIIDLANNIKKYGLKNPPIGSEGIHRTLAHILLQIDMPYYRSYIN
jgi:hypothetical protein